MNSVSNLWRNHRSFVRVGVAVAFLATAGAAVSAGGSVNYTALGDSLAFGAFAPIGRGYVPLYRQHIQTDNAFSVQLFNLGIPGWSSRDLLQAVRTNLWFRLAIVFSPIVTKNIGGNDLRSARNIYKSGNCGDADNQKCLRDAVALFKVNWDGIVAEIRQLRRFRPTILRTMDIYNPYVNEDKASDSFLGDGGLTDFQALKPHLDEVNAYIASTSAAHGILVAQVYAAFNGPLGDEDPADKGLLAFDGVHPNGPGHALIANLLRELGYSAITP